MSMYVINSPWVELCVKYFKKHKIKLVEIFIEKKTT
jgi:hypothetical protein